MAYLIPLCYMTALDNAGNVITGGARGYIYQAGTTNALPTASAVVRPHDACARAFRACRKCGP
jgi:hypothetical protein